MPATQELEQFYHKFKMVPKKSLLTLAEHSILQRGIIHFKVITDHRSLKWLTSMEKPTARLARWIMHLQPYDFEVIYRKGEWNKVADALSRSYEEDGNPEAIAAVEDNEHSRRVSRI
uniref:Reverse transcriptase RNase H-like domain-containing protein n=1 Tax=Photinus pyralis TaxID=7054 RepID=A0A1Y1JZK9_PHOPY